MTPNPHDRKENHNFGRFLPISPTRILINTGIFHGSLSNYKMINELLVTLTAAAHLMGKFPLLLPFSPARSAYMQPREHGV